MRLVAIVVLLSVGVFGCADDPKQPLECGFSAELLPYEVGYTWTYRVTDLTNSERKVKEQRLDRLADHADYGQVIVQITYKGKGTTESYLRREGDEVRRYEQRDLDSTGALVRTTIYEPYKLRIHEGLSLGEQFVETYTKRTIEPGVPETSVEVTDVWEVTGEDVPCETETTILSCVEFHRERTAGGVATKDYLFAPGVGKVIENGAQQVEELEGCGKIQ